MWEVFEQLRGKIQVFDPSPPLKSGLREKVGVSLQQNAILREGSVITLRADDDRKNSGR